MKVWPVYRDSNDGPELVELFSTADLANEFAEKMCAAKGCREFVVDGPFEVDAPLPFMRDGLNYYSLEMHRTGDVRVNSEDSSCWFGGGHWLYPKNTNRPRSVLVVHCRAKDRATAISMAEDKRADLIFSEEWPADPE